ncbi:STAS domain-containing protein [Streptomyces sp. NPDC096033]|uniref:STAS domain-containing protein n=1 Tax=Streptomyces sp. NPDC096033 TaxID=3366071 RepID=UPI0038243065
MDTHNAEARSRVEARSEGDVRIVVMAGEFDMDNVADLRAALDPAAPGVARFVLDVAEVTFVDSTALSIMLQAALDHPVVLAGTVPRRLARLLEITGADLAFATAPTVAEATHTPLPPRQG